MGRPVTSPAIRIDHLSKRFGDVRALDDVSFDVPSHSIFGLLGANGAGKTTLFSIVANFLRADGGSVEVLGVDVRRISELRGRMTILPQDAQFQRSVPILEQLTFFRELDGLSRERARREVIEGLEKVGLADYARRGVRALSHGMAKRLGIAQAFLGSPEVILLDEPTSGLDPGNARQIRDMVRTLQSHATIVISSHNLAEIQDLCDHVAILDKGRLIQASAVAELTRAGRELDLRLSRELTPPERERLRSIPRVLDVEANGPLDYTVRLGFDDLEDGQDAWDRAVASVLSSLLEIGVVPRRLSEGKSLENHFLRVTTEEDVAAAD